LRVLVVEDEQKIAQFLKKGLDRKGYAVETVGDADTALERVSAPPSICSFSTCLLPGSRDGWSCAASCGRAESGRRS
jgi:DNA-binding response OmpR family regulator